MGSIPRLIDRPNYMSRWSTDEIDLLAAKLREGVTIREIATEMGRSQEAVRGKAWQHGLLPKRTRRQKPSPPPKQISAE